MALGPQLCGHIGMNYALGYISATLVSVLLLFEPVGAGILAIPMLGEIPTQKEMIGSVVILLGLMVVFFPLLTIYIMYKNKVVSSLAIPKREERIPVLILVIIYYSMAYYIFRYWNTI